MKTFAIFGNPVSHSRSPLMHNYVFKKLGFSGCYTRVHLDDGSRLRESFFELNLDGANITVPHKEAAYLACDEVRGFATKIGVVNTIVKDGEKLIGYNTDADGFLYAIEKLKGIKSILIFGAGGTSRALSLRLLEHGFDVSVVNRSAARFVDFDSKVSCRTWDKLINRQHDLVVNTTSAGLKDDELPAPVELVEECLQDCTYAIDVIYGKETPFLQLAKQMKKNSLDGASMLLGQGVLAHELFVGGRFSREQIEAHMIKSFEL